MAQPIIANVQPGQAMAEGAQFTLTVNGAFFISGAVVWFGGAAMSTTYLNQGQLSAVIPASAIQDAGAISVYVVTSGGTSNTFTFIVSVANPATAQPQATDLITVGMLQSYLFPSSAASSGSDANILQFLVSAGSVWLQNQINRWDFNAIQPYSERYDGTGQDYLYLRHYPIVSVTSVVIGGVAIPQSTDFVAPGWAIAQDQSKLVMVSPVDPNQQNWMMYYPQWQTPVGYPGQPVYQFIRGRMNCLVAYSAGYVQPPLDVQEAVAELIAQNYQRRGWIDKANIRLEGGGSSTFRDWIVPPKTRKTMEDYTNRWVF
jgi:hypothetical protein